MTSQPNSLPVNSNNSEMIRRKLTQYCLKSMSLEGVEADSEVLCQLQLLDCGKITMDEFVAQMLKKAGVERNIAENNT